MIPFQVREIAFCSVNLADSYEARMLIFVKSIFGSINMIML